MLTLVKYNEHYLEKSYNWLTDPEIQILTDGPFFLTREIQQKWYVQMMDDPTYVIWGIDWDGVGIGACGIKHIDFENCTGEYWGYIGEKEYWGGKGHLLMSLIYQKAKELNLKKLYLVVLIENKRAFRLYESEGFSIDKRGDDRIYMSRQL